MIKREKNEHSQRGSATAWALMVAITLPIITFFVTSKTHDLLEFTRILRISESAPFIQTHSLSFLANPDIVRGLIIGGDAEAQNCWSGLIDKGCKNNKPGKLTLKHPGKTQAANTAIAFSETGALCTDGSSCFYQAQFTFTGSCKDNVSACRAAQSGTLKITLIPQSKSNKDKLFAKKEAEYTYQDMYLPILKAWDTVLVHFSNFVPAKNSIATIVGAPAGSNLDICRTAKFDNKCVAGQHQMHLFVQGFVNDPKYLAVQKGTPTSALCNPESNECAYRLGVRYFAHCSNGGSLCDYASKIDYQFVLELMKNNTTQSDFRVWNFETPVGTSGSILREVVSETFSQKIESSDVYLTEKLNVTNHRGDAMFTNCGQISINGSSWQHLFCNKDGNQTSSFNIVGKKHGCNTVQLHVYSNNSSVNVNTQAGTWTNYLKIWSSSPYNLVLGMEDSSHNPDWDMNDYIFELVFPAGMRVNIPHYFNTCN